jgi:hypothetical protein
VLYVVMTWIHYSIKLPTIHLDLSRDNIYLRKIVSPHGKMGQNNKIISVKKCYKI